MSHREHSTTVHFQRWEWEVFNPKFWCPRMAGGIVSSQFFSLDFLCLLSFYQKPH